MRGRFPLRPGAGEFGEVRRGAVPVRAGLPVRGRPSVSERLRAPAGTMRRRRRVSRGARTRRRVQVTERREEKNDAVSSSMARAELPHDLAVGFPVTQWDFLVTYLPISPNSTNTSQNDSNRDSYFTISFQKQSNNKNV